MRVYHCTSLEDTHNVAKAFGQEASEGAVFAFFGDLGAGKTTFIRSFVEEAAGIEPEAVNSPTFQYLNIYKGKKKVYHFDLYRLKDSEDFFSLGFDEMLASDGICCIEWAERIAAILPEKTIHIKISHASERSRTIEVQT